MEETSAADQVVPRQASKLTVITEFSCKLRPTTVREVSPENLLLAIIKV